MVALPCSRERSWPPLTLVIGDVGSTVLGCYTLATGSVARTGMPHYICHDLSNPVPIMVLVRLAIDRRCLGLKLGSALLREAMLCTFRVSEKAGVRALFVHAIDDKAIAFLRGTAFRCSRRRRASRCCDLRRSKAANGIKI
jgi:hypothetical protein